MLNPKTKALLERVVANLDEAMDLIAWYKTETGNDYNGKALCCQEDGERNLAELKFTLASE